VCVCAAPPAIWPSSVFWKDQMATETRQAVPFDAIVESGRNMCMYVHSRVLAAGACSAMRRHDNASHVDNTWSGPPNAASTSHVVHTSSPM